MNGRTHIEKLMSKAFFLLCQGASFLGSFRRVFEPRYFSASSAFALFVAHVVGMRSKKNVRRVCAFRVVAFVQNMHPIRDGSEMNHPRHTTRSNFACQSTRPDHPVSLGFDAKPLPALIGLFHLGPKSLFKRFCHKLLMWVLLEPHYIAKGA